MTTEQRIKACMERHPDWDNPRIQNAIGGTTQAMIRAVREGQPLPDEVRPQAPAAAPGVISLEAVRARYDIVSAIYREIGNLKPGALILETEMRVRAAGKDANRFRRAVENTEAFKSNRIKLKLNPEGGEGAWYWGDSSTVAAAAKLRDSV